MTEITREMAGEAAAILKQHPRVHGVELFGSIAREGSGNDLDLIVITDDGRGRDFIASLERYLKALPDDETARIMGYDMKNGVYADWRLRRIAAWETLGRDFGAILREAETQIRGKIIDLFVFPRNWRDYLRALQEALPHEDPNFMRNIAADAVAI